VGGHRQIALPAVVATRVNHGGHVIFWTTARLLKAEVHYVPPRVLNSDLGFLSRSVSGGVGSPRKTTCGPRSVRLYHPYKVADRRPCPPHPKNCIAHPKNCAASTPNGLFTCSPFDLSHQPTVRGL
jgi:hypothetical protein